MLDLVAREMARKHTAFYNIGFSEAKVLFRQKLARKWGHAFARGWATSGSPEGLRCSHFGPLPSLPWPHGHVRLIGFLGLVCAVLLFFSTS